MKPVGDLVRFICPRCGEQTRLPLTPDSDQYIATRKDAATLDVDFKRRVTDLANARDLGLLFDLQLMRFDASIAEKNRVQRRSKAKRACDRFGK